MCVLVNIIRSCFLFETEAYFDCKSFSKHSCVRIWRFDCIQVWEAKSLYVTTPHLLYIYVNFNKSQLLMGLLNLFCIQENYVEISKLTCFGTLKYYSLSNIICVLLSACNCNVSSTGRTKNFAILNSGEIANPVMVSYKTCLFFFYSRWKWWFICIN